MGILRGTKLMAAKVKSLPPLLKTGTLVGVASGLAVGMMVQPLAVGLALGAIVGGACGAVAGHAMARDDARANARTRQLDDIIGITDGSLGTPPESIPPGDLRRDPEEAHELEVWAHAWLTPPPPAAR